MVHEIPSPDWPGHDEFSTTSKCSSLSSLPSSSSSSTVIIFVSTLSRLTIDPRAEFPVPLHPTELIFIRVVKYPFLYTLLWTTIHTFRFSPLQFSTLVFQTKMSSAPVTAYCIPDDDDDDDNDDGIKMRTCFNQLTTISSGVLRRRAALFHIVKSILHARITPWSWSTTSSCIHFGSSWFTLYCSEE